MTIQTLTFENTILRCAVDAARVGLCVLDDHETILLITDRFASALGKNVDDLLGQQQRLLLSSGLHIHNFDRLFAVNAAELASEAEWVGPDGQRHSLLLEGRTFTNDGLSYRVVSIIEITDFGVTRDRLIELRRQADAVRTSVVVADARQPDMPIVYANPQFFEVTGYRPTEVIGRNCRFLQGPGTEPESVAQIRNAIANQRTCSVVLTNYRKDGTQFRNELTISPLTDHRGNVTHFLALQRALSSRDPLGSSLGH